MVASIGTPACAGALGVGLDRGEGVVVRSEHGGLDSHDSKPFVKGDENGNETRNEINETIDTLYGLVD